MFKLATKLRPSRETLNLAKESGYSAAELWTNAKSLRQFAEIQRLAKEFALDYAIHFPNKPNLDEAALRAAASLYRQLACRAMVIHEPMLEQYGAPLLELDPGLRLGVENHRLDKRSFRAWAERNTWLTLDVEHLWMLTLAGEPLSAVEKFLEEFLRNFAAKLIHVHLPGYLPGGEEHRPMYCSRDFVMMTLSQLCEFGFEELVVSEVNLEFQNKLELEMDQLLFERWKQLEASRVPNSVLLAMNGSV